METIVKNEKSAELARKKRIVLLNDQLRKHGLGGRIMLTPGVFGLGEGTVSKIMRLMREYCAWDKGNDPYGEHDFGMLTLPELEQKVYFKIDYYDEKMEFGSDDPSDPKKTTRVLTLMLTEEY